MVAQSGGVIEVSQLRPQPLNFVKQTSVRGPTRLASYRKRSDGPLHHRATSQSGRTSPRRASPACPATSSTHISAITTVTKHDAYGLNTHEVIRQKPFDTPIRIRKTRGSRASGSESTPSISSKSSYAYSSSSMPSQIDQESQAVHATTLVQPLPRFSSISLENCNPSLQSHVLQSTSTLAERPVTSPGDQVTPKLFNGSPKNTPKRHPSNKKRVFTRMLGGFQAKPKISPLQRNGHLDGSLFRKLSGKSESASTKRSKSLAINEPSSETLKLGHYEYNETKSPQTPRNDRVVHSLPTSREPEWTNPHGRSQTFLPIANPEYSAILNLGLQFIAEVESLDCKAEKSIWVAVEGSGVVGTPASLTRTRHLGLDVVVVIDNSHTASQECLNNAHKNVILLAEMLNRPNDRLAVFCTNCQHRTADASNLTGCHLHRLQEPCVQSLKDELQSIKDRPISPFRRSAGLDDTVGAAVRFLSQPTSPGLESLRDGVTHVFVFSAKSADCLHVISEFPSVYIHLVNPSVIPFPPVNHEWRRKWTALVSALDNHSVLNVDICEDLSDRLRQTILHARTSGGTCKMTEVKVKISPAQGCHLEGMLGATLRAVVRPNQKFSLLVRIRVDMASTHTSLRSRSEESKPNLQSELDEAMADLQLCLGETEVPLFTAQAIYHHSLLPDNSFIFTEGTFGILKTDCTAPWSTPVTASVSPQTKHAKIELHKRLAFFIATNSAPKEALRELDKMFRTNNRLAACPEFVNSVRNELHHQLLVMGYETSTASSTKTPLTTCGNHFPCLGRFSFEANDRQQNFALGLELSKIRSSSDSPATVIHQRTAERITEHTEPDESIDEAAQIWRHMRKNSKSRRRPLNGSNESLELMQTTDERLRELRKRAIQNKRSIGADTLRSLSLALTIPTSADGGSAPWL